MAKTLPGTKIVASGHASEVTRLLLDPHTTVADIVRYLKEEYDFEVSRDTVEAYRDNYVYKKTPKEIQRLKDEMGDVRKLIDAASEHDEVLEVIDLTHQIMVLKSMLKRIEGFIQTQPGATPIPDVTNYKLYTGIASEIQKLGVRKQQLGLQAGWIDVTLGQFTRELIDFMERKEVPGDIRLIIIEGLESLLPALCSTLKKVFT